MLRGHSKSTFVVEGRGEGSLKNEQNEQGEGGGALASVYVRFFKKNAEILEVKFYSYCPVFPTDYNGSMKY